MGVMPSYKIEVEGKNLTSEATNRIVDISVSLTNEDQSDSLTLTLNDAYPDQRLKVPDKNDEIKLSLGYDGDLSVIGTFVVDNVTLKGGASSVDTFTIQANSIDMSKKMQEMKYQVWQGKKPGKPAKLSEIIEKIAKNNGLKCKMSKKLKKIKVMQEIQRKESDMSFLRFLAQKHNALVKFYGKDLIFIEDGSKTVGGKKIPLKEIDGTIVSDWDVNFNTRWKYQKIKAEWWDTKNAKMELVEVKNSKVKLKKEYIIKKVYQSKDDATSAANAKLKELRRSSKKLSLTIVGDPEIIPLMSIKVDGVREHVDGKWKVTSVQHSFSSSGFTTTLSDMEKV